MAERTYYDCYSNAIIDISDMTITEFKKDCVKSYNVLDVLRGWSNIPGIKLELTRVVDMPAHESWVWGKEDKVE